MAGTASSPFRRWPSRGALSFCEDRTPTNTAYTAQYSLFTSVERIARAWLGGLQRHRCAPEKNLSSAVHHEHIIFLIHFSFYHHTSTRITIGTTRPTPRTHSASSTFSQNDQSKSNAIKNHSVVKINRVSQHAQHILHILLRPLCVAFAGGYLPLQTPVLERPQTSKQKKQSNSMQQWYDTATCNVDLVNTAIWLGKSQTILMQIANLPTTYWPVDSNILAWPRIQLARQAQADVLPLHEDAHDPVPACALRGRGHHRWRRDALQLPERLQPCWERDTCAHIPERGLRCASWNTRGLLGSTASSHTSRDQKNHYLKRLADKNDVVCLQETHGKDEFLPALQVLHSHFRMFGTFIPDNVNAGGSAILIHKGLLPDHAVIAHGTTQQERDHVIRIRTDESALV